MLQDSSKAHTISILVANKPGVLTRVSQVFPAVASTSTPS